MNITERFEKRTQMLASGCLVWKDSGNGDGYARTKWNGVRYRVHRLAYILAIGPIPVGTLVLHRCDVRNCVNPEHLFLGTVLHNNADRDRKGRQSKGEDRPAAKLSDVDVRAIRNDRRPERRIAAVYGIAPCTVHNIKSRKAWRHVA